MADEDEIDVLGEFSFNSCFAQNNQGIPSCSNREDTVHPQWLLDSTATNWYDIQNKNLLSEKKIRKEKVSQNKAIDKDNNIVCTEWTRDERGILVQEMAKYGRNVRKISQTLKTKTEPEILALIEAEHGINLDTPSFGLDKHEDQDDVPAVVQEIVTDDIPKFPTKQTARRKYTKSKNSLLKPDALDNKSDTMDIDPGELVYEDDLMLGSTESIGSDLDLTDIVSKNIEKFQRRKAGRKMGNHRRKTSASSDKGRPRNKSKDHMKSPQGRQRKDSSLSEDSMKSPKMHIVLGTGHTLPVSEGEQVIKIEKKKDSEPESDIEVDIDSDNESGSKISKDKVVRNNVEEPPIAVPLEGSKFEPMRKRAKKINLDGGGGYTIMHTVGGDLLQVCAEPRKERLRRPAVQLLPCRLYNHDKPAPFEVRMYVSAMISMDVHAHTSRAEVMGLLGGTYCGAGLLTATPALTCVAYRRARAAAGDTHCDMDPVSQSQAAESLRSQGLSVCAWHHSHPSFPPAPSAQDLATQRALQTALEWSHVPFLGIITSQHWPTGRTASQYRCIRVEDSETDSQEIPIGYQLSVKLVADLTADSLTLFLDELAANLAEPNANSVDVARATCPQANMTYLNKCISSVSHHMRSAGYADDDPVVQRLLEGIRDIFR